MDMSFEEALKNIEHERFRLALITVGDTCEMAKRWFETNGVSYTGADILRFCELTLQQERTKTET